MTIRKFLKSYSGLDRSIYFLCLAQVVNSIGHFVHPFLTMFLTRKIGMDPVEAGTYVMLSAAAWVPGSLLGGKIADQIGRKGILVFFQSLAAAVLVPCAFLGVSRSSPGCYQRVRGQPCPHHPSRPDQRHSPDYNVERLRPGSAPVRPVHRALFPGPYLASVLPPVPVGGGVALRDASVGKQSRAGKYASSAVNTAETQS